MWCLEIVDWNDIVVKLSSLLAVSPDDGPEEKVSETFNVSPLDSRRLLRIHAPARGFGIFSPFAIVFGDFHSGTSILPLLYASTTGAHPVGWTAMIRGRLRIHPSLWRILNIFHIPTSPTPPPTG